MILLEDSYLLFAFLSYDYGRGCWSRIAIRQKHLGINIRYNHQSLDAERGLTHFTKLMGRTRHKCQQSPIVPSCLVYETHIL